VDNEPVRFICDNGDDEDDDDEDESGDNPDCIGEITSMMLMYTGDGCPETSDDQHGLVLCLGDADALEPVNVLVTGRGPVGSRTYAEEDGVFLGDVLEVRAVDGGVSVFNPHTSIVVEFELERMVIQTSCSEIVVGDQVGSLLVVGLTSTLGGTVIMGGEELECSLAKATFDPFDSSVLLEGEFCENPIVRAGQTGGQFEELYLLDSGANFILVAVDEVDDLQTCVFQVECPCETCTMEVAFGDLGGPQGPTGPTGPPGADGADGATGPTGPPGSIDFEAGCGAGMTRIGHWCVDDLIHPPKNFAGASEECHDLHSSICPVEAVMLCDVLDASVLGNQASCINTTDSALRIWTSTYDAAFGQSVLQAIIIYDGDDNTALKADQTEVFPFYCCQAAFNLDGTD